MEQDPNEVILGLFVGNIGYLLVTYILFSFADIAVSSVTSEFAARNLPTLVEAWIGAGILLGILDIVVIAGFFASAFDGSRGGGRR